MTPNRNSEKNLMTNVKLWKTYKVTFIDRDCPKCGWLAGHVPVDLCPHLWQLFESRILSDDVHTEIFTGIKVVACRQCAAVLVEHYNDANCANRFINDNFKTFCICRIKNLIAPAAVWGHSAEG